MSTTLWKEMPPPKVGLTSCCARPSNPTSRCRLRPRLGGPQRMQWKVGDKCIYPVSNQPATVVVVHHQPDYFAVLVELDRGGVEPLFGRSEVELLRPARLN